MTPKERMLAAARGQWADRIAFAPRIDLWFHANKESGALPPHYRDAKNADEIALAEGWALHKVVLEFMSFGIDAIIDRPLGIYRIPTQGFLSDIPEDVERRVVQSGDEYRVEYHTPLGVVSGVFVYTEEMRRSGISVPWIKEHVIKTPADYPVLGYIFEHMRVSAAYDGFIKWSDGIGENGLPVAYALTAGSPMHHIMKILLDSTDFYYKHNDHKREMSGLAEKMAVYFDNVLDVVSRSPAEVILVGANFDDMLTYPPFFEEHILPWLKSAADRFHQRNKLLLCHTDGENKGLMDLLLESGMDVADSVCPYPMTKISLSEYYRKWGQTITIFGGIPSNLMLRESATDETFEAYLEELFSSITPGKRIILGIADTTPPGASFERIRRIQQLVAQKGELPLKAGPASVRTERSEGAGAQPDLSPSRSEASPSTLHSDGIPLCKQIQAAVLSGDNQSTVEFVRQSMAQHVDAQRLLNECLLPPMDLIGERFTDGSVFIPEVLLSARALNESMLLLEPELAKTRTSEEKSPLVILGTVKGDLHDIGKNLVGIMLKSVGLRVKDLGVNVSAERFVQEVATERPAVLALSALLTTTMPEFKRIIEALKAAGLREHVKVIVGGAPVSEQFAVNVGADAYGADAGEAAAKAKKLVQFKATA